jgi:urease gamma subunit
MLRRRVLVPATVVAASAAGGVAGAVLGVPGISGAQESPTTVAPAPGPEDAPTPPEGFGPHGGGFEFHHRGPGGERGMMFGGGMLDAAAKALGMTSDELMTQLKDGKSIKDIAAEKDVELSKVADAIVAEMLANLPDEAELRDKVESWLENEMPRPTAPDGEGPQNWKMHPDGAPEGGTMFRMHGGPQLDAAAEALGISVEDLQTELRDGKTIADVAQEKNVDVQKVIDAMVEADRDRITDYVNGDN